MMATEKTEMILGTRNHGKIAEFRSLFKGMHIKLLSFYDFPDVPPVVEDGKTFRDNADKKAKAIAKATGRIAVSDDSGLEVDFLDGVPGVYSARFAGARATDRDNARKVLKMLDGVAWEKRSARFVCVICAATPKGKTVRAEGSCTGTISFEMRGSHGFGYDPIFIPDGYQMTMAEIEPELKNRISHRADAMEKFRKVLKGFVQHPKK
jgi:XTP/dITP diphosphohydrolase